MYSPASKVKMRLKSKCSQKKGSVQSVGIWNMMIVFVLLDPPVLTYHLRLDFFSIRFNRLYCSDDDFRFWKREGDLALVSMHEPGFLKKLKLNLFTQSNPYIRYYIRILIFLLWNTVYLKQHSRSLCKILYSDLTV